VILKPFNPLQVVGIFLKIMRRKAHESAKIETYVTERLSISRTREGTIHYDGEPAVDGKELNYLNKKGSLNVIVGRKL
jgi:diacylglycerol kinase family enzyme